MSSECPFPPRLVELSKWDNFPGYGFNLHAEKSRPGQYVGMIDPGSPSQAAGLREGDRIVEVNGVSVSQENHKQVVGRIKSSGTTCSLLVVDREGDQWHKECGVIIRSSLPYTVVTSSKEEMEEEEKLDLRLQVRDVEDHEEEDLENIDQEKDEEVDSTVSLSRHQSSSTSETSTRSERSLSSSSADKSPVYYPARSGGEVKGLNLNMSAREMRARIGERKKRDPRMEAEKMDWWQRHHIVQTL